MSLQGDEMARIADDLDARAKTLGVLGGPISTAAGELREVRDEYEAELNRLSGLLEEANDERIPMDAEPV